MYRLYRVLHEGTPRYVVEQGGRWRLVDGDPFGELRPGREIDGSRVAPLVPIAPSKIVAVGLNYRDHAAEMKKVHARQGLRYVRQLIFPVEALVEYVSFVMTLLPGDVIPTGTPAGVGPLVSGDRVTVKIEEIGELTNPVEQFEP